MSDNNLHPVLKEALAQPGDPNATPVEKQHPDVAREEFDNDLAAVDKEAPTMREVRDLKIPGPATDLEARLYIPDSAPAKGPVMIYYHGGGNIRGNIGTHDSTCRVLANAGGFPILSIEYRLAPEHPFPAAADDAFSALKWASQHASDIGGDASRILVGGDSAGGNLAAAVCLRARDESGPAIAAQMLIYPVIDHVGEYESKRLYSKGYMLDSMPFYTASYLPDPESRKNPMASPIFAESHSSLPPAFILTCSFDPLHDEGCAYAAKLTAAGVTVDQENYPDMIHGFTLLRGLLTEADPALEDAARRTLKLVGS